MKKLWFILACVSMAVLVVVGAAVAFAPEHAHEFVAVTTKPTCTADGETVYTCSCGRTYSEKIAALGHKVVDLEGKEANCVEAGITTGSMCAVCNEVFVAQEKIPAFGHDIVELAAVEANCTQDGLTAGKYCTKCDYEVKQTVISASGHNIVADAAVTADCNNAGLTAGEHCTKCDYKVEQEVIPALGHDVKTVAGLKPTCTDVGLTQSYYCTRCDGYNIKADVIPATGHTYDDEDDTTCNDCGKIRVPACKHPNTTAIGTAKEATCTDNGITAGVMCVDCGEYLELQQVITAFGHDPIAHAAQAVTCTVIGWDAYETCSRCDYSTYVEIPALGHAIVPDAPVAPTCTATGLTAGEHCTRCDYKITQNVVDALGHTEAPIAATPAKCLSAGLTEGKQCTTCGVVTVEQQIIPAPGHTAKTLPAVAPVCLYTGLTEGSVCSVCGDTIVEQTVVPSTNTAHVWNGTSCTVCGATKFEAETFEITNPPADKGMVGDEGKGAAGTNYPSGDAFIYNLQYAMGSSLKVEVKSEIAQKAVVTVNMGRRQYVVNFADIFTVKVNGEVVEANAEFGLESDSSLRYYDWVEVIVATIDLKEGTNVIEFVKNDNDRGLNFDYMSIYGLENGAVLDPRETNGHVYDWTFVTLPTYESAGSVYGYCKFCRDKLDTIDLPVISAENGYTKLSSGVMSRWEYNYNGHKIYVDVPEESQKYMFDVTAEEDIFTNVVDNNGIGDGTSTYNTNKQKNSFGWFYELTQGATFTVEVSVEEAADVVFILRLRSTANTTFKCGEIINSISVVNNGQAIASEIRNDNITFLGWYPENTVDAELAVLSLQPGKNVITFTMNSLNINISGVGFGSFVPVELLPATVYGGTINTFDPFATANGGTLIDNDTTAGAVHGLVNAGTANAMYQNLRNSVLTFTVYVEEATTIRLRLGFAYNNTFKTNGIATITSVNANGQANKVTQSSFSVKNTKWTVADAVILELATIELAPGENTITLTMANNNINITGVYVAATNEVILGKKN